MPINNAMLPKHLMLEQSVQVGISGATDGETLVSVSLLEQLVSQVSDEANRVALNEIGSSCAQLIVSLPLSRARAKPEVLAREIHIMIRKINGLRRLRFSMGME